MDPRFSQQQQQQRQQQQQQDQQYQHFLQPNLSVDTSFAGHPDLPPIISPCSGLKTPKSALFSSLLIGTPVPYADLEHIKVEELLPPAENFHNFDYSEFVVKCYRVV